MGRRRDAPLYPRGPVKRKFAEVEPAASTHRRKSAALRAASAPNTHRWHGRHLLFGTEFRQLEAAHPEIASRIAEAMQVRAGQIAELA
jgi:hypothetical protein